MKTRRQIVAGSVCGIAVLLAGCWSFLDGDGLSPSDGNGMDGVSDSTPGEGAESPDSAGNADGSRSATIATEIGVDRSSRPRVGEPIAVEFAATNEGTGVGRYDYRLRLEHEDGLLGGDEPLSGTLPEGTRRVYDLEFVPPRAGDVCLLLEKDVVDEFTVRSRRSDDGDSDSDEGSGDDEPDGDTSITTGGNGALVGEEATAG
ncbi:hypothetical protein [Halostagnicola sp. A-GB9-2]|uniref:hypothetical protein n=1 Tax=Halostagnicola sp. A-GB9-2 TaxID=3048066 RepID=UPI0024C0B52E|nr:hypothetical protein [Halostagnicola sp. A-GB9-2]MDJ1432665.1 hypothetical protein [Halostagnicola sp. A-GB9-2]